MSNEDCRRVPLVLIAFLTVSLAAAAQPLVAQQMPHANASLSVNGTGYFSAGGAARTNSQVSPTPVGSAPVFHHRTSPLTDFELVIQGPPNSNFILLVGQPDPVGTAVGGDTLELSLASAYVLIDGLAPKNLLDWTARTGLDGEWSLRIPTGILPGFPSFTMQAIIVDPSNAPFGLRLTPSLTVEVDNTIATLIDNTGDAVFLAGRNPNYLASLLSSNFTIDGEEAAEFVADNFERQLGLSDDTPSIDFIINTSGPNTTNASPLPTGPPAVGQVATGFLEFTDVLDPSAAPPGVSLRESHREYDLQFVEQNGVWRFAGDQIDVDLSLGVAFAPGGSNPQGIYSQLFFEVEAGGQRGGVVSVSVTGPQLASINGSDQATTPATGTVFMNLDDADSDGSSEWSFEVEIGNTGVGTSRFSQGETAAGPRDSYIFTINWADGSTSGPYTSHVRSAVDPGTNPAAVLAAIPGQAVPLTGVLNQSGTPNASIDLTFSPGNLPAGALGQIEIEVYETFGPGNFIDVFALDLVGSTGTTVTLDAPFFTNGNSSVATVARIDVFGTFYGDTSLLGF